MDWRRPTAALALILIVVSHAGALDVSVPASTTQAPSVTTVDESTLEKSNAAGLSIFGEGFYVWPRRDNLQTAILSGSGESLTWFGSPGLRVGVGYRFPDTSWDAVASFAYFHAKSQRTIFAPDDSALQPVLTANPAARGAGAADGDSGLSYAVIELDIGKSFVFDNSITLRFFGGARLASIDQSLKCIYSGGAMSENFDFVNAPVNFQGAGLTAGAEASARLYRALEFYGQFRSGLLGGQFTSVRTETLGPATIANITDRHAAAVPLVEGEIGLRYQREHFYLSAGFDLVNWFNMIDGLSASASRRRGNLTLEAITVKVGYVF